MHSKDMPSGYEEPVSWGALTTETQILYELRQELTDKVRDIELLEKDIKAFLDLLIYSERILRLLAMLMIVSPYMSILMAALTIGQIMWGEWQAIQAEKEWYEERRRKALQQYDIQC